MPHTLAQEDRTPPRPRAADPRDWQRTMQHTVFGPGTSSSIYGNSYTLFSIPKFGKIRSIDESVNKWHLELKRSPNRRSYNVWFQFLGSDLQLLTPRNVRQVLGQLLWLYSTIFQVTVQELRTFNKSCRTQTKRSPPSKPSHVDPWNDRREWRRDRLTGTSSSQILKDRPSNSPKLTLVPGTISRIFDIMLTDYW